MIFTIPLTLIYYVVRGLIATLPTASSLPIAISDGFTFLFGLLYSFDFLISVSSIFQVLTLSLSFEFAIQLWHGFHWLLRKIPMLQIR